MLAMSIDRQTYLDVNSFARDTSGLHGVLKAYALWGGLVALALLVVIAWLVGRRSAHAPRIVALAFLAGASAVIALVVNQAIGPAIGRVRPCRALHHVEVLLTCAKDSSLPSDHAMIAGAFAVGLLFVNRWLGALAVLLALLLAFARVYVGVHYPGDVVVGLLIGGAIGLVVALVLRRPVTELAARLTRTPLGSLVAGRRARAAAA